tara:strand:+ start:34 stop:231 length:198 start_codon:yes stop_codon:yes gene_type:complete
MVVVDMEGCLFPKQEISGTYSTACWYVVVIVDSDINYRVSSLFRKDWTHVEHSKFTKEMPDELRW